MWWRCDPVPGTRCRKGAGYCRRYLRHPSTAAEIRQYYAYPDFVRPNRRPHNLPNVWDDIYREGCWYKRNWKLYRKTQWK